MSIDLPGYARKMESSPTGWSRRLTLAYHHPHDVMERGRVPRFAKRRMIRSDCCSIPATDGGVDYTEIVRRSEVGSFISILGRRRDVLRGILERDASFNTGVREGFFTVPGDGDVDFSELARFVKTSGYGGWVIVEAEQDPARATPWQYAEKAYRYVKDLMF
jgi:hypothetical protein